jgi:hypothetical protein
MIDREAPDHPQTRCATLELRRGSMARRIGSAQRRYRHH